MDGRNAIVKVSLIACKFWNAKGTVNLQPNQINTGFFFMWRVSIITHFLTKLGKWAVDRKGQLWHVAICCSYSKETLPIRVECCTPFVDITKLSREGTFLGILFAHTIVRKLYRTVTHYEQLTYSSTHVYVTLGMRFLRVVAGEFWEILWCELHNWVSCRVQQEGRLRTGFWLLWTSNIAPVTIHLINARLWS